MIFPRIEKKSRSLLVTKISLRAEKASPKVKKVINENIIPALKDMERYGPKWLLELQKDLYQLARNPKDPIGGSMYDSWTSEEIQELYFVVYGEEIEENSNFQISA